MGAAAIFAAFALSPCAKVAALSSPPPGACLYALDRTAANAFQIAGAQSVYTACGVVSESSSSSAFEMEGSETLYLLNHSQVSVVGGANLSGQTYLYDTLSGRDVSAVQTSNPGDPLSSLSPPTTGTIVSQSHTYYDMNSKPANNTILPGIYCGGLTIGNTNGATFTFSPGTYIMAGGGLTLNSEAKVSGTGVTFYNTSSAGWGCSGNSNYTPVTISGQVNATLSAPASGAFNGILFFGNRTGCSTAGSCVDQINGGSTAILNGALYFKSDEIEITGSNASGYTMLVADKIYINGNSNFAQNGSPFDPLTVSVSPTSVSLYGGQTQQFSVTVQNTANPAVTWTISPSSSGSINSSGLYAAPSSITAQQTVTVTATSQADDRKTATAAITLLPPAVPTITWATPAAITYGTPLSAAQLNAVVNAPGTVTYSPGVGTILSAGMQTLRLTFTPANPAVFTPATASVTLAVNKAAPSITWTAPAAIAYPTPLSATQLDATASVPGTFVYSPAAGSVLTAGSQLLNVTFTPSDTTDYTTATASVPLTVTQVTPTITWTAPAAITYGTALTATQLDAAASVPGTFTYSPAIGTVPGAGNQTLSVTFTPTDAVDYTTATANVPLTVTQAAPVITWAAPAAIASGTALSATQLDATANVPGTFVYSPAAGFVPPAGTQTLSATFTPTDAADYTTATASVTLTVNQSCNANGYGYGRAITIDHTKVPNTDQTNFPFLFSATDPLLATTANGGHVASPNGYDIVFTSDPAGQNPLNYEMEEYNPATGQMIAWVQIPGLSHTADTTIYLFYGNPSITTSQQNPTAVWDANYVAVWHFPNGTTLSTNDSTRNGINGTPGQGVGAAAGIVDGGASFNGSSTSYISVPSSSSAWNFANDVSVSAWVKTASNGVGVLQLQDNDPLVYLEVGPSTVGGASNKAVAYFRTDSGGVLVANGNTTVNDDRWHYIEAVRSTGNSVLIYVDGALDSTTQYSDSGPIDASGGAINIGGFGSNYDLSGSIDEVRVSNIARSADWIAAEYANQSAPGTFFSLSAENQGTNPGAATLYAGQSQQFSATPIASCNQPVSWSISPQGVGTLTQTGTDSASYTAPATIATQQTLTITATNQTDNSTIGASVVTLSPSVSVSVSPAAPTLYAPYESIQFTATLSNAVNSAVTWSISPNVGSITQAGLYTAPYFSSQQTVTITATSVQDPTQSGSATLTLMPVIVSPNGIGVRGGFTYQFTANVPVNWSIAAGGVGTIDQTGLYTAPINGPFGGIYNATVVVATAQADPNASNTAYVYLFPPIQQPVTPAAVSLIDGQSQTFDVCMATSATNTGCQSYGQTVATWSISPAGAGSISASGVYTAPATIPTNQTVIVTATDIANPAITSTATISLIAPVVSVTPDAVTLYPDQEQQFTAVVTHSTNTAVSWSISPAGMGSISSSGVYTAPPYVASQQTVTVTAASQAIPSITSSATITLSPAQCPAKAYSYVRPIVIDHTRVPNSDQPNFPFYFAATDPLLASTANGGHVTSPAGNDIVFSSDSAGLQPLPFDLEQYNPATGKIAAWVKLPVLSHSQDTVIYMFYGNAAITAPQQNSSAVWDASYAAVYQFENLQNGALLDSTINGNNASSNNVQESIGQPGAAAAFDGSTSYVALPANDFASFPYSGSSGAIFNASFGVWFKTSSSGIILGQTSASTPGSNPGGWVPALYIDTNGYLRANFFNLQNAQQIVSPAVLNDNDWHYAVLTFNTNATQNTVGSDNSVTSTTSGVETVYVDGQVIGSESGAVPNGYSSSYSYYLGTGYAQSWAATSGNNGWFYFNGSLDEVEVSSVARSGGWVQSEYNNQSSPSTFFTLGTETSGAPDLNPPSVTLYQSQSQQFAVLQAGMCSSGAAAWSLPAGSPGTLSPTGLYTAPATISTQQTVTITATTLGANSTPLNAAITLMPPVSVTVTPGAASLAAGGTQQFTATVANASNTAVNWTLSPAGPGSINASGLYTAPATLAVQGQTVSIIATSQADATQSASATVTLGTPAPAAPAIAVNPQTAILYPGQTQEFTASLTNTPNTAVTWSISPTGAGTIDANGVYTAPATISAQQTVTITAASQENSSLTASATVALAPVPCASNGYSYVRAITIDHTKVPNTDQTNFPFLFSTTDPLLATTANGGHVASANGYDIIFTSDPAGQVPLSYEMEEYNPATGQMVAWVQIPDLSHTSDTVIYLFYGNPNVASSQQNPAGIWDLNYKGVWHLGNGSILSLNDSTGNANNATDNGALAAPGPFAGAMSTNGSTYATIGTPASLANLAQGQATFSAWVYSGNGNGGIIMGKDDGNNVAGWALSLNSSHNLDFVVVYSGGDLRLHTTAATANNTWSYVAVTLNGSATGSGTATAYINGVPSGTVTAGSGATEDDSAQTAYLANATYGDQAGSPFLGSTAEMRISNTVRSADWIATEYANQSSPATFAALSSENQTGISPGSVALYSGQSQQFTAPSLCSSAVTWSLSADAQGTLSESGLYTAPGTITAQQTVTVTATTQGSSGQSATATVTLMPPVAVTMAPASVTLSANQAQQFAATVANAVNPGVAWSISPAGAGVIDQNGGYVAPSTIATQQTVTVTATSLTDPTKYASAMITLAPNTCASTGYGYQRVIVIDHTRVANTDQANFPFLFNSTDPDLATLDHGGHVTNPNGDDIIFSTDPNGQTRLDFEIEQYNPATGQLVAWIRIPSLSHSADTVIYVFYGNPSIAATQANPAGVWDSNYQAVYHLGSLPATDVASDSTNYGNQAVFTNFAAMPGEIDGSAALDGVTSFLEIPASAFPNYPTGVYNNIGINTTWQNTSFDATYGIWFKTSSWGGLLDQTAGDSCESLFGVCLFPAPEQPNVNPDGSWGGLLDINFDGYLEGRGVGPSTQIYNDNNWHHATITFENGVNKLYADGQLIATGSQGTFGFSPNYAYFVGTADVESDTSSLDSQPWKFLPGQIDEINVSNVARSGDWIQTQFNNQSSPSTFYKFYSPSAIQVAPSTISLYASQSEQFTVPGTCDTAILWSIPAGSSGALTATGLYTAPSVISGQQTVTVSAMSQSTGASLGSAQVTLLPPPQPLTLTASSPSPYQVNTVQSFTATLLDPQGNPLIGLAVNFTVAGPNETVGSATTGATGTASFTYSGANNGTDTVQATASVDGNLLTSNSLTAAWITPPPAQVATVMLLPQPSPGRGALMGAFTDNNGDLIEPIALGTAARTFITPAGATRLQLGINDTYYQHNGGAGFVVAVNGVNVTVPPTAMPWNWKTGGLNNNFQYGTNDGASPVIAAASLTAGQPVTIAYQSGTISTNYPVSSLLKANGDSNFITGTQVYQGAYFPTLYTTASAYPQNQPINLFAVVVDSSGAPIPNTPVTLTISGANPGQYQATTDTTGTASFLYTGAYTGNDSLQAQATIAGPQTLTSNLASIDWTNYPTPPPVGSLSLNEINAVVNSQNFSAFARDASGNALPNVNVGFYITGADNIQTSVNTNNIGQAYYSYYHSQSGNYSVIAVDSVDRNVIVTPAYTGTWTVPAGTQSSAGGTITITISGNTTVTMPNATQLTGTVTDNSGLTPADSWSEVSGPGAVTFANPNQATTTATFSQLGTYVLQLSATDTVNSGWAQFTVTVVAPSIASQAQGQIGSPAYGSAVSGIVPITLAPDVTLASGTLSFTPTNNTNSVTVINPNVSGSGQIGVLDTTALANGAYWIQMQAIDSNGNPQYSLVLVNVTGNFKPGRVTSTVTDLVVPATGLPIEIQRTYDSLNAGRSLDFGYGWSLGINVDLVVDPSGNVTFTLNGQRKTFYLTPQAPACTIVGCLFPYYFVAFTPQPGLHGSLTDSSQGCPLDIVVPNGSLWDCYQGAGQYNPPGYVYTDPNGTAYSISASGALQSVTDRNGNGLTITPNGITSSTGLNVPFMRDSQGRITQITDPAGNVYLYQYDTNGNLASVTYPNTPQPSTYTYTANHYYLSGTDFRSNPLPSVDYYVAGDTDSEGDSLAGKMKSVTDGLGETTSYAYDLTTNTTTVTYPPDGSGNTGTATMVYDSQGDLLTSTDPLGHTTTNAYNADLNLTSTTDPLGHTTRFTYDASGNKTSTTYPATATSTNTTSYTNYNQYSEPTSTVDEDGNTRTFNYDANYNPASVTDSLGTLMSTQFNASGTLAAGAIGYDITQAPFRASQFTYDANGNLASKTDALGRTTSYTYNALGQKITMTEPIPNGSSAAAATTTYTYDAFGNLTQTQAPLGRITSSTYDANSNKLSDTDARKNTTSYKYDALNRLTETDYPDGTKSTKTYDFRNNVVMETDQGGHVTLHQYDLAGRQTAVIEAYGTPNATTTSYAYDSAGHKISETDALGHTTTYIYDAAGNLLSTSGVKGNFTYAYDNAHNRISQTDGDGNKTQYAYDARKRLTVTTYPNQTTRTNAYDGPGNLASVTDQAGNQAKYSYDAANQLINVVQLASPNTNANTTVYGYDSLGNPITLQDANSHATIQNYDLLSEQTSKVLPDGQLTEARAYDSNGNLQTVTHFNGAVTTYTYDTLNRLLSRSTPGEATVSFTYTPTGQYATSTDASGTTTYTYDNMDRITSKATPEGTLNYTYDAAGHVASIASSNLNGASMAYSYDDLNRLSTVTDNRTGGATTYSYDSANNVATVTYPNRVQSTFAYDTLNRVTGLSSQPASYTYQRGPTGNLTSATESSGRQVNWTYDGIYRLTNETISLAPSGQNGSVGYGLDPVGNRLSESSSLPDISSGSWSFNPDDELSSETYDANGNVTATGGKSLIYDSENHLISMTAPGKSVSMVYDAFGNRVAKTANGVTTQYLVEDDKNPTGYPQVFDELTNGAVTRTYTYGLQRIGEEQVVNSSWMTSYYGYDGGGNVRQLTNSAGTVTDTYEYDAFGNSFAVSGSTPNNYLYRGEQLDPDLSLYYLRARYYNPTTGRFMSRDPLGRLDWDPKTLHKYLYAEGDPINGIDPTGREDYIESIFTRTLVSSPLEVNVAGYGRLVAGAICGTAKVISSVSKGVAPGVPSPIGIPFWSFNALAILCGATGF